EILDFAQKDELEKRPCKMCDVLPAVHDAIERTSQDCQASFELDVADDVEILCDPTRIHRVLVNLMSNALQAAGPVGWARLAASEGDTGVNLEVTDSGPGIPEANLHRVFNPFFTTKDSGTGLGLAICHRIVEAHGGTIRAGNIPGGGARFV